MKKKTFKKAGVAVLSMAMLLSMGAMATPVSAISNVSNVTITKPSEATAVNYVYVKIADATYDNGRWEYSNLNELFDDVLTLNAAAGTLSTSAGVNLGTIMNHSADAQTLATALADKVTTGTAVGSGVDLAPGYYILKDTTNTALPVLLSVTDETTDVIAAKVVALPFNKTIEKVNNATTGISKAATANKAVDGKTALADTTDTIEFKIATEFPTYNTSIVKTAQTVKFQDAETITWDSATMGGTTETVAEAYYETTATGTVLREVGDKITRADGDVIKKPEVIWNIGATDIVDYVIEDVPEDSITIDMDNIVVKVDGATITTGFTLTKNYENDAINDGAGFKIVFDDDVVIANGGKSVVIEYTGTLDNPDVDTDANNNSSKVTYSNDFYTGGGAFEADGITPKIDKDNLPEDPTEPGDQDEPEGTPETEGSDADIFCTIFTINKVDGDTNSPLTGAEFTVTKKADSTVVGTMTATGATHVLKGLKPGVYTVSETTTPRGYKQMADFDITVSTSETGTAVYTGNGFSISSAKAADSKTLTIENYPGQVLPATGGIGTILFTVGGATIVLLAGAMFVLYMKKRKIEE